MLERMKRRLPDARDEALMLELLDAAREIALAYTRRRDLPRPLEGCVVEIAVILYNRMGMEGESAHDEGSVRRSAGSLPDYVVCQLNAWRLAGTVDVCG